MVFKPDCFEKSYKLAFTVRFMVENKSGGIFHIILVNGIRILLVLAYISALIESRRLLLVMSVMGFVLTFIPNLAEYYYGKKIPALFELLVLAFIYGVLFLGEVRGLFGGLVWWDIVLNLVASIALGLISLTVIYSLFEDEVSSSNALLIAILAFSFTVSMGTLWELFEFGMDHIFAFNFQDKNLTDTMRDLLTDTIGALIISSIGYYFLRKGKKIILSTFIQNFISTKFPVLGKRPKKITQINRLIKVGEKKDVEFKSTIRINLHTNEIDKKMEHSALKTIVAFLNSSGGILLLGVSDDKKILGIEKDGFENSDKYQLHLSNLIKKRVGKEFSGNVDMDIVEVESGKNVLRVRCSRSRNPAFLKEDNDEEFYVRHGPSSIKISGREMIEYIRHNFK